MAEMVATLTETNTVPETAIVETTAEIMPGALHLIDRALGEFAGRQLVSAVEVTDTLLDVRNKLAALSLAAA